MCFNSRLSFGQPRCLVLNLLYRLYCQDLATFKVNTDKTWHTDSIIWFLYELYFLYHSFIWKFWRSQSKTLIILLFTVPEQLHQVIVFSTFMSHKCLVMDSKGLEVRCEHVVEGRHLHQFSVHSVVVRSRRTPWHDILSRPPRRHFQSLIFNPQNIKNAKYSSKNTQ